MLHYNIIIINSQLRRLQKFSLIHTSLFTFLPFQKHFPHSEDISNLSDLFFNNNKTQNIPSSGRLCLMQFVFEISKRQQHGPNIE